jgi:hypothetical protein
VKTPLAQNQSVLIARRNIVRKTSAMIWICLMAMALAAGPSRAQHSVSLTWTASTDAAANPLLTYNVYRLIGACPASGTAGFTKLNAAPVMTPAFTDANVGLGNFCYYVTATLNGAESVPSNTASAVVLPGAPTLLKFTSAT